MILELAPDSSGLVRGAAAFCVAVGLAVGATILARMAASSPGGLLDGQPGQPLYVFAVVALIAAAGDLSMVIGQGLAGARRIARHLWRMCLALWIGVVSLFLGQPQVFPEPLRHQSGLRAIPVFLVLVVMAYWLGRVLLPPKRWLRRTAPTRFAGAAPAADGTPSTGTPVNGA